MRRYNSRKYRMSRYSNNELIAGHFIVCVMNFAEIKEFYPEAKTLKIHIITFSFLILQRWWKTRLLKKGSFDAINNFLPSFEAINLEQKSPTAYIYFLSHCSWQFTMQWMNISHMTIYNIVRFIVSNLNILKFSSI